MKARVVSQLPLETTGPLKKRELASSSDGVGFSCYEFHTPDNGKITLSSTLGPEFNHVYYVVEGAGKVSFPEGNCHQVEPHLFFALTGQMEAVLEPAAAIRLFVTYVQRTPGDDQPDKPVISRLSDIIGTERDIDWSGGQKKGQSRRFLRQDDGFNVSVHYTICYKNNTFPLVFKKNFEVLYYVKGDVTYKWGQDFSHSQHFQQTSIADGDACVFIMNEHEEHEMHVLSQDSESICVFYPPLKGTETHDFSKGGPSSY